LLYDYISEIDRGIHQNKHSVFKVSYLSEQYQLYRMGYQINPDNHLLSVQQKNLIDIIPEMDKNDSQQFNCYSVKKEAETV